MDRLGWRTAPRDSLAQWDALRRFADTTRRDGLTHTVVCGMGGSSLAPDVLAASFANPSLSILDSTDPRADPSRFVAITDPGSALEALARERGFRAVFPHPPDVGGRYAALTVVGM